jgi:hypothetical protein
MKVSTAFTLSAITIYSFGFIAALFYTIGINPTLHITSQPSYYLGIFAGIIIAGILLIIPIVSWGILISILNTNEKKEGE